MRKIRLSVALDPQTFQPKRMVMVKDLAGNKTIYKQEFVEDPLWKYPARQREMIRETNAVLMENGQPVMTMEEMDWFADPDGLTKKYEGTTEEELQALAGFKVEKVLVPFPSKEEV